MASSPYVRPLVKKDGKNAGKGEIKVRSCPVEVAGWSNPRLAVHYKS